MMPSSNNNDEGDNNELDGIQRQMNEITDKSLESSRRMVGYMAESHEIGGQTLIMLDEQGEKLNRIEDGLININVNMNIAEENLANLQKCCGLCVLPWRRVRRTMLPNTSTSVSYESSSATTKEPQLRMAPVNGVASGGYINRITNDDREEQMDDHLQVVSDYLGQLNSMAVDMGNKVKGQTDQAKRMTEKTDLESNRVVAANKLTENLIRHG